MNKVKINIKWFIWLDVIIGTLATLFLGIGSAIHKLPFGANDVFAFVTGGLCVWLLVKKNIWTWPIGILNGGSFVLLFWRLHLYADAAINFMYIILGFWGWYAWKHVNKKKVERVIAKVKYPEHITLFILMVIGTYFMQIHLKEIKDSSPFWDALTTSISLVATWLQTRKYIENWYWWIAADVIYIPLYFVKHVPLTAILYILFMAMCFQGLWVWRKSIKITRSKVVTLDNIEVEVPNVNI